MTKRRTIPLLILAACLMACSEEDKDGGATDAGTNAQDAQPGQDAQAQDANQATDSGQDGGQQDASSCPPGCTSDCPQGCFDLGDCQATGGTLDLHANILTVGVMLTPANNETTAEIYYRTVGETVWLRGHDADRIPDDRVTGSIFALLPETTYEVMVRTPSNTACAEVTTQPEILPHNTTNTLYVDASAPGGGNGTQLAPFTLLQDAIDAATAGTDILVAAGLYHEQVDIEKDGTEGSFIRILGEPGAIVDGADRHVIMNGLTWTADGTNIWHTPWTGDPRYLCRDGARIYHYITLTGLQNGIGDDDIPIAEGYFVDGGELYIRSNTDPSTHTWQIPSFNAAFRLDAASWIWIEGLEVRFYGEGNYGKGIDVRNSHHVVVSNNHIHEVPTPVSVRRGSNDVRVMGNRIHQSSVPDWPWAAVKGTDHENSAIRASGGRGAIVANNEIWAIFNGIYTGEFSDDQNTAISFDVDAYKNRLGDVTDDGLEPEGACINNRFWENTVDRVHSGVSLAPITYGPVWVLRNRFTAFTGTGFKFSNDSSGRVYLYHNTNYTDLPDQNGNGVSGYFANMVLRNNVIRGTRYAFEMSRAAGPNDLDYDNLFTTRGPPVLKWDNTRYDSLAELCTATNLECHGQPLAPGLIDPANGQFAPASGSPNVDVGVRIYGINDDFIGTGPDIGYVEEGAVEVEPLP